MSMTQEEMCVLIQTGTHAELIPALWESVQKLYTLKALRYYNSHRERCAQCGAAPEDLQQQAFFAFLRSIDEYKPDEPKPFTAYINLPFLTTMQELLCYRTARGRNDALNRSESLDRELDTDESSSQTLHDIVPDVHSLDFMEQLDAESIAEMIRAEVRKLPERMCYVIEQSYFSGATLEQIAAALDVSTTRAGQLRQEALRKLSRSRNLAELHRAFYRSEKLRMLELESRRNADAQREYFETVRFIRELSGHDKQIEEECARMLWTAGAAEDPEQLGSTPAL